jgi:protein ATS1
LRGSYLILFYIMATVYALGSNRSGQLGIGHKEDVSVPKEVLFQGDLTSQEPPLIRAGGNHTLLLSAGELYFSGDTATGACGLVTTADEPHPHFRKILFSKESPSSDTGTRITHCAATWEASIIVRRDASGYATEVYSFGTGNKGELGLGELIFRSARAERIKDFPPTGTEVVDLAASVSHAVAVLSNGDVYGWGNGRKGQLGHPESIVYDPRKISSIGFKIDRAVCGREFTYLISKAEDRRHVLLGADKRELKSSVPAKIGDWTDVGASWGSIFVMRADGSLLSWGRNDHGQLAPPSLPGISQIAVGSEHVLVLTTLGDVLAWGWGEHGNCGPSTTNGDVKGRWNVIASLNHLPPGRRIVSIGSGCATSWVFVAA